MPDKNAAAQRVLANAMTLREMGYDVTFIGPTKDRNNIVPEFYGFKCDYINYLETGKPEFHGEYMTQYSWAEATCAMLLFKK